MTLSRKPVLLEFFSVSYWPWIVGRIYNVLLSAHPCNRRALLIIHRANVKIASIKLLLLSLCFFLWMLKTLRTPVMMFIGYYAKQKTAESRYSVKKVPESVEYMSISSQPCLSEIIQVSRWALQEHSFLQALGFLLRLMLSASMITSLKR